MKDMSAVCCHLYVTDNPPKEEATSIYEMVLITKIRIKCKEVYLSRENYNLC